MLEVKDGHRIFKFDGEMLAESSSRRGTAPRWIEFRLFKTAGGQYVISRIGKSLIYHEASCSIAARNDLEDAPRSFLDDDAVPCIECHPDKSVVPVIAPEQTRYWASVCETADRVINSLYREDETGRYMTRVTAELLEKAAKKDSAIADAYFVETIS